MFDPLAVAAQRSVAAVKDRRRLGEEPSSKQLRSCKAGRSLQSRQSCPSWSNNIRIHTIPFYPPSFTTQPSARLCDISQGEGGGRGGKRRNRKKRRRKRTSRYRSPKQLIRRWAERVPGRKAAFALADLVTVGSVFTPAMVCFGTPFSLRHLPFYLHGWRWLPWDLVYGISNRYIDVKNL